MRPPAPPLPESWTLSAGGATRHGMDTRSLRWAGPLLAALSLTVAGSMGCIFTTTRPGPADEPSASASTAAGSATASTTAVASAEPTASASASVLTPGAVGEVPPCTTAPPPQKPPEAKITLLDPGAEPRKVLRYKPRVGLKHTLVYGLTSDMRHMQGDKVQQQQGMAFDLTVEAKIVKADERESRFEFKVKDLVVPDIAGMPKEFNEAVREQLSAWKKAKGSVVIDARGMTQEVDLGAQSAQEAGRLNDIRVALEQTSNPLPEEPIGVGAKWEVATIVDTGLLLRGKTVFELVELKGNKGKVRFTIDQKSDPKPGPAVCPQPHVVVQPTLWSAAGTGERSFDLGELIVGKYETKLKVHNESRTFLKSKDGSAQAADVRMDVDMQTRMSTAK